MGFPSAEASGSRRWKLLSEKCTVASWLRSAFHAGPRRSCSRMSTDLLDLQKFSVLFPATVRLCHVCVCVKLFPTRHYVSREKRMTNCLPANESVALSWVFAISHQAFGIILLFMDSKALRASLLLSRKPGPSSARWPYAPCWRGAVRDKVHLRDITIFSMSLRRSRTHKR